ncbi:MAG: hypothetical protein Fur0037_10740 [Planctomycetota bacterium]
MRRITGTHVYGYAKCPRLAALDLSLPRERRRPPHPWEEFAARRGRDFEAAFVAKLEAREPIYPERDFERGAEATLELLREGVPWVYQGVLRDENRLGLPDLLRRVPGESALGSHHYEVVDVKTSGMPRSDQILQVMFYSRLLGDAQGRLPERGALILKDGTEHAFPVRDFMAVAQGVEERLLELCADPGRARPFAKPACESCHWNEVCLPELEAADDLSLVHGMTEGARWTLERLGFRTAADLAGPRAERPGARGPMDATLFRRLRRAAKARKAGRILIERHPKARPLDPSALLHLLADPFENRVLAFGVLFPAGPGAVFRAGIARAEEDEWPAFLRLLDGIPSDAHLLHFGPDLPRWYERRSSRVEEGIGHAARFLDLARRLRHAAILPGPAVALADFVRLVLGRDPLRAGHAGEAAIWAAAEGGESKIVRKLREDLEDLLALKRRLLDGETAAAMNETCN